MTRPLPVALLLAAGAWGGHDMPLDRPYTLRNGDPFLLEREYHRMIREAGPDVYIFPRACVSAVDSSSVCPEGGGFSHRDPGKGRGLSLTPVLGLEYRRDGEDVGAFDLGSVITGHSGPASFYLDARLFSERHEDPDHRSYDREFVERQEEEATGAAYSSYSRFRSNATLDFGWARLGAARDAVHWGPGQFGNLVFNQAGVPFNHLYLLASIGPVTVISLYGQLTVQDGSAGFGVDSISRSVYAHRYEWRPLPGLTLGLSEELILYNQEAPFAFAPIVPLFMVKGVDHEHSNNGNLAADVAYTLEGVGRAYAEFLVDDLQSPTSIFSDFWADKWAALIGVHAARDWKVCEAGAVAEYARVEPWVYTHYVPNTAQSAHAGHPLGNPLGPNSQSLAAKIYARGKASRWYLSARADLIWKGDDFGSSLEDGAWDARNPLTKRFLHGVGSPDFTVRPYAAYAWKRTLAEGWLDAGPAFRAVCRLQLAY